MARKKTETATESSKEIKAKGKFTRAKKCMKTTTKKFHESGKNKSIKEEKPRSKCSNESPSSQDQKLIHTKDGAQEVSGFDLNSGKVVRNSGKMKLQLFPLDARTRKGLEKDGFHPYLELTFSSRKKVSSVLQHINSKWGKSEISRGDPALYTYDHSVLGSAPKLIASNNITTGDIYGALGSPSVFRLRYGWSSDTDNKTDEPPSPSTPSITCFPNEEPQSAGCTGNQVNDCLSSEITPPDEQVKSMDNKTNDGSGPKLFSWDDGLTSLSIGGLLSEVSLKGKFGDHCEDSNAGNANVTLWEEGLTNISIGGLFSEASLQHRIDINREQEGAHTKSNDQPSVNFGGLLSEALSLEEGRFSDCNQTWETKRAMTQKPLPLISDSLDAFLVNQTDQPQAPCPAPPTSQPSHSSILDAEDTCHAFSFRKRTTTPQPVLGQVSEEAEKEQQNDESKPAKPLFGSGSMVFNQDSSLGFSGFKWAESRGPFDFGLSSSQKFTNGDSVSFGAIVKDLQEMEPLEEEKIKLQSKG